MMGPHHAFHLLKQWQKFNFAHWMSSWNIFIHTFPLHFVAKVDALATDGVGFCCCSFKHNNWIVLCHFQTLTSEAFGWNNNQFSLKLMEFIIALNKISIWNSIMNGAVIIQSQSNRYYVVGDIMLKDQTVIDIYYCSSSYSDIIFWAWVNLTLWRLPWPRLAFSQ